MSSFVIKGHDSELNVSVLQYERPDVDVSAPKEDVNWLTCSASVLAGPFSGKIGFKCFTEELADLLSGLRQIHSQLSGQVKFKPIEEELGFSIEILTLGKVRVAGFAKSVGAVSSKIMFQFDSDQSYIQSTILELEAVVREFPKR